MPAWTDAELAILKRHAADPRDGYIGRAARELPRHTFQGVGAKLQSLRQKGEVPDTTCPGGYGLRLSIPARRVFQASNREGPR